MMQESSPQRSRKPTARTKPDGLRWGFCAAAAVELGGTTLPRLCEIGGVRITHEWHGGTTKKCRERVLASVMAAMAKGEGNDH